MVWNGPNWESSPLLHGIPCPAVGEARLVLSAVRQAPQSFHVLSWELAQEKSAHERVQSLGGSENLEIFTFFIINNQNGFWHNDCQFYLGPGLDGSYSEGWGGRYWGTLRVGAGEWFLCDEQQVSSVGQAAGPRKGLEFWAEEVEVQDQGYTDAMGVPMGVPLGWLVEDRRAVSRPFKGR